MAGYTTINPQVVNLPTENETTVNPQVINLPTGNETTVNSAVTDSERLVVGTVLFDQYAER